MFNIINKLHNKELEVLMCLTNNPNSPAIAKLQNLGIKCELHNHKVYNTREEYDKELVKLINTYGCDLVVLSGFMRILTDEFTSNVKAINLHPSLLPLYKGSKAIERSYEGKETDAGVSVHYVSSELDGGEMILQKSFTKTKEDSFDQFSKKIKECEYEIFPKAIIKALKEKI